MRLQDKIVVITGAGSGLGRECSLLFATEGASLVLGDVNDERLGNTVDQVASRGGTVAGVHTDVSVEADVQGLVAAALEQHGRIDVMFNNAGVAGPMCSIEEITEEQFRRILDINLMSAFFGCKHVVPSMKANGGGTILNTSSAAALAVLSNQLVYSTTKAAVNMLTQSLAVDLGPYNIRVNALCPMGGMSANFMLPPDAPLVDEASLYPDWKPTDSLYPLARPQPPRIADHASAALFLASDESGWCSGVTLPVDGAMTPKCALDPGRVAALYAKGRPKS